jgi:hypothetical protein
VAVASRASLAVSPTATLHVLHLLGDAAPTWLRGAQLLAIAVTALVVARTRGPLDAMAASLVVRLLVDNATYPYYAASVLLVVAVADLARRRPAWRTGLLWLCVQPAGLLPPAVDGWVRALGLIAVTASFVAPWNRVLLARVADRAPSPW